MQALMSLLNTLLPVAYALTVASYARIYALRGTRDERLGGVLLRVTLALHILLLAARGAVVGHLPLAGFFDFLSAIGLSIALVYLYVESRAKVRTTGIFLLPWVFFLQCAVSAWGPGAAAGPAPGKPPLPSFWFELHTLSAVVGCCAFAVSAVYGVLFLAMYRAIKANRFARFFRRMPPLETLGRMNLRSAVGGFACLTASIALGYGWMRSSGRGSLVDPQVALTLGVWGIFGFAVFAHHRLGWRGPRAAALSLMGFTTLVLAMVAVNLFLPSFHVFH